MMVNPLNNRLVEEARNHLSFLKIKSPRDERVLEALAKIDRADFLLEEGKERAYYDKPIYIEGYQTCSQPSLVALMADLLELKEGMKVAEIGTGSGYSAALTTYLIGASGKLFSFEIIPELAAFGRENLQRQFGLELNGSVEVIEGDGVVELVKHAPYDRIYFTAGVTQNIFPKELLLNSLVDGGILLYPTVDSFHIKYLKKIVPLQEAEFYGFEFVPLQGKYGQKD